MLHHTIGRFRQRGRRPQRRGKLQLQKSSLFRPVNTDLRFHLCTLGRQIIPDISLGISITKNRLNHPSYRPVLNDTDAGNLAALSCVTFIQGAGITASLFLIHQMKAPNLFPVAAPVHSPGITVRFHHSQPKSAFPEVLRTVHTVGIQIPGLRVDFYPDPVVGKYKAVVTAYLRTLRLLIHHLDSRGKTVHAGRLQNRAESHPLTPVQIHIAAFLFHLAFQNLSVLAEHGKCIGICPVLVGKLEFSLENSFHRKRMGIVNQNWIFPLLRLFLSGKQGKESPLLPSVHDFQAVIQYPQAALLNLLDGGTGKDIMEFTEHQRFLRLLQLLIRINKQSPQRCLGKHFFSHTQLPFQLTVLLLYPYLGRIAAHSPVIQILFHHRLRYPRLFCSLTPCRKICLRRGVDQIPVLRPFLQLPERFQIRAGRPASVVSHAPEDTAHCRLLPFRPAALPIHPFLHCFSGLSHQCAIGIRPVRRDPGTVKTNPDEIIRRKRTVPLAGPAEQIGIIPRLRHQLDKPPAVAEGIKIDGGGGSLPEFFQKIFPAALHLPDKGFPAGHITVGLQIPAPHNMPFPFLHQLPDPCKKRRLHLFNPVINQRLIVVKNQPVILLAENSRHAERGNSRGNPLFHIPQPYRINMRIAYQM